jgi:hypothetical protein
VITGVNGEALCLDGVTVVAWEGVPTSADFTLDDLDVADLSAAFGAGFLLIAIWFALGRGVGAVLRLIRG